MEEAEEDEDLGLMIDLSLTPDVQAKTHNPFNKKKKL